MLKIKDNVDLKELEKFGFAKQKQEYAYGYYFNYIEEDSCRIVICKPVQDFKDRQLFLDCIEEETDNYLDKYNEILFDLIQAGLVEKV